MIKLRLLKVIVQPIFVIDDGETLTEKIMEPIIVDSLEWPTFADNRFVQGVKYLSEQLEKNVTNIKE